MDEFSSAEEGEEWVKKNGVYEYTPDTSSTPPSMGMVPPYPQAPFIPKPIKPDPDGVA